MKRPRSLAACFVFLALAGESQARELRGLYEAPTFVAYATATIETSTNAFTLMNASGSSVVLRIHSVKLMADPEAAVTGLVAKFGLRKITGVTIGTGVDLSAQVVRMDTGESSPVSMAIASLSSSVTLYRTPASVSGGSGQMIGSGTLSTEETTAQYNPILLYEFTNRGETPLTLRAAQGVVIEQGDLTGAAGIIGVQIVFTQE